MKNIKDFLYESEHGILSLEKRFDWDKNSEFIYIDMDNRNYGFLTTKDVPKLFNGTVDDILGLQPGKSWTLDHSLYVIRIND